MDLRGGGVERGEECVCTACVCTCVCVCARARVCVCVCARSYPHLCSGVVGNEVWCGLEWYSVHWPVVVVGQVGGEDTDMHLTLTHHSGEGEGTGGEEEGKGRGRREGRREGGVVTADTNSLNKYVRQAITGQNTADD